MVCSLTHPSLSSSSCVKKEMMVQNLLQWSVADVASYFSAAGFPEQSMAFRTQVGALPPSRHRGALWCLDGEHERVVVDGQRTSTHTHTPWRWTQL